MSEMKFDPVTGQPINQPTAQPVVQPGMQQPNMGQPVGNGPKFDPVTGKPIQPAMPQGGMQQPGGAPKFNPVTGQPMQPGMPQNGMPQNGMPQPGMQRGPAANGPKFDPVTGQPIQMQRVPQQGNGGMKFDPKTGQPIQPGMPQNGGNKGGNKTGLILGVVIAAVLVLGIGGFALANGSKKKAAPEIDEPVVEASIEDPVEEEEIAAVEATSEEDAAVEATTEETEEPKEETKVAKSNVEVDSSSLFSFNFDGTDYSLPMPISDLIADGWQYNDDNDAKKQLATSQDEYIYLQVPGDTSRNHVTVYVKNFSNNAMALGDCYVTKVELDDYTMHKLGKTVTVQNGAITLGVSKAEDVKAVLGEADNEYDGSSGSKTLTYYGEHDNYGIDSSLRFYFGDTKLLTSINIENDVEPEDFVQAEVSDETPEYLSAYVEPKELGSDPLSGNVQIDKKVYNLPCPMQKFLDNGWSYNVSDDTLGAGQRCLVPVAIGDDRIYLEAVNPMDYAVHLNNTIVVAVQVNVYSRTKLDFQIPGGINISSTDDDIKKFLESNKIENYEYKKDYKKYTIPLDQKDSLDRCDNYIKFDMDDDGSIDGFEVQNYGWLLED